ncbi:MAG: membrane dipeptidase [Bacilli bacterium]
MFDSHYDLLTVLRRSILKKDYTFLQEQLKNYQQNNVTGLIANLYFMTNHEMQEELHQHYFQNDTSVYDMFKETTEIINNFALPIDLTYSIEGCTYLEISDLKRLYDIGLKIILPVWNDKNKYGSGNREQGGLTSLGRKLINEAIDVGLAIDVSHANEETFNDILDIILYKKFQGLKPIVLASHSNCYSICPRKRNLTDEQLQRIKNVDGYLGILSNINFIKIGALKDRQNIQLNQRKVQEALEINYLRHIHHAGKIIGLNNIILATDDMSFLQDYDTEYAQLALFPYATLKEKTIELLQKKDSSLTNFTDEEINNLIYNNGKTLVKKITSLSKMK